MKNLILTLFVVMSTQMVMADANAAQCTAELQTRNGRTIDVFRVRSSYDRREACKMARAQCERELRRRQRNGRNPYASCQIVRRDRRDRDLVTRTCSVYRYGRRGGFLQSYFATATGRDRNDVKRRACNQAMRKCDRDRVRAQYCQRAF